MGKLAGLKQAVNKARRVYQGSPHKHKGKLDADKIGTGEGAQAYGYGHYVAESDLVAEGYRSRLSSNAGDYTPAYYIDGVEVEGTPEIRAISSYLSDGTGRKVSLDKAKNNAKRMRPELSEGIDAIKGHLTTGNKAGHLYEYDLNESAIDTMLDWDAPLSEQPEVVQNRIASIANQFGIDSPVESGRSIDAFLYDLGHEKITGSPEAASAALKEAGIPGIKYFDGGSRTAGEGTRNFVIFPGSEGEIKAVSRNGEKLAMLGGILGGSALMPEESQAATLESIALQGAGGWKQRRGDKTSKWKSFKESYLQPAATVATALGSMPVQGLAGIGALAQGYGIDDAVGAMESTGESMTYMPDSEAGMESLQNMGEAMDILGNSPPAKFYTDHINQGADWAAENIHPAAGTALKVLPEVIF